MLLMKRTCRDPKVYSVEGISKVTVRECIKIKVGNDQELTLSERNSTKNRGGKNPKLTNRY